MLHVTWRTDIDTDACKYVHTHAHIHTSFIEIGMSSGWKKPWKLVFVKPVDSIVQNREFCIGKLQQKIMYVARIARIFCTTHKIDEWESQKVVCSVCCNKLYDAISRPIQFVNFPIQLNFETRMQQNSYAQQKLMAYVGVQMKENCVYVGDKIYIFIWMCNEIPRKYGAVKHEGDSFRLAQRQRMGESKKWSKHGKSDTIWYWLQINVHLLIIISKPKDGKLRQSRSDIPYKISSYIRIKFSQCYPMKPIP